MMIRTRILLLLLLLGACSCAFGAYPDEGYYDYPPNPYYRGYPEDYFNNRPGYNLYRSEPHEGHEHHEGDSH